MPARADLASGHLRHILGCPRIDVSRQSHTARNELYHNRSNRAKLRFRRLAC